MPLLKEKLHTIDDIYNLPDGERAELIDGCIYMPAPPNMKHQSILGEIYYRIKEYIKKNEGSCKPFVAPFAVFLSKDSKNYVEPDISVICDESKLTNKGCVGAPDWVIEIVSTSSRQMDYMLKLFKYKNSGVREYWIVDPEKEQIMVYNFENDYMKMYNLDEVVKAGIYADLEIDFSTIE